MAQSNYRQTERVSFPKDEQLHPWLAMLLNAYHIIDQGVAEGIRREERQGRHLACAKGCSACCRTHKDIPVYPLELVGLTWYATEQIRGPLRQRLKDRLRAHPEGDSCPFLVDGVCSVHRLRPVACRQFNVFGQACAEGEDAYHTRRQDVLTPIAKYSDEAFYAMLPFYGVERSSDRRRVIKDGSMHRMARTLASCNWASLADKMDAYDDSSGPDRV